MCGRFTLRTPAAQLAEFFDIPLADAEALRPRYNVAPSQQVAAVRIDAETGRRRLVTLHWGLIPAWAAEPKTGYSLINARAETVASKPSFKQAFLKRRCLILADGFFEWQTLDGAKQPFHIHFADGRPFAMAGMWERWKSKGTAPPASKAASKAAGKPAKSPGRKKSSGVPTAARSLFPEDEPEETPSDGLPTAVGDPAPLESDEATVIESCTIIVTQANDVVHSIHDRMPVILSPSDYGRWLDPEFQDAAALQALLRPYAARDGEMETYPVATIVNSPRNDVADCVEPLSRG